MIKVFVLIIAILDPSTGAPQISDVEAVFDSRSINSCMDVAKSKAFEYVYEGAQITDVSEDRVEWKFNGQYLQARCEKAPLRF